MKTLDALKQRAVKLQRDTLALWFAYKDRRTPWYARLVAALVVAYAFSPIDLIPDFIPILGYLDDLVLVPAGIALSLKLIPAEVMADARRMAELHLREKKPAIWWMAAAIVIVWVGVIAVLGWTVFRWVKK